MKVRYTRRAQRDLERMLRYLDERSPRGSDSIERAIRRTTETIAVFPSGGRLAGHKNVRERPASPYPYIVYWTVVGEEAHVLYIRHAKRRPPDL